jgi:drug/metabolite transporter (DMT)-like permease
MTILDSPTALPQKKPLKVWVLLVILGITWGSSFILVKQGLKAFTPQQVASLRVFIAFLALVPFWLRVKKEEITSHNLKHSLVVGTIGSALPAFLFAYAQTHITSSVAGVLNSLTPLFTLITGYFAFKTSIRWMQVAGVLLGLAGAAMIIILRADGSYESDYSYALLILLAAFCYSISANTVKAKLTDISSVSLTTIAFTFTGPFAAIYLWYSGAFYALLHVPEAQHAVLYLLILGALGTAYAWFVYNYLIKETSALFASAVTYLMPLIAVMWGVFDGEPLGLMHIGGMALILLGVWLTGR